MTRYVSLSVATAAGLYVVRVNPEILTARGRVHQGKKGWDRILLGFLIPTMLSIFPVAVFDDGRFHGFPVPWWVRVLGYVLLLAGIGLTAWAQAVNKFFELGVRNQADRGQGSSIRPVRRLASPRLRRRLPSFRGHRPVVGFVWVLVPAGLASLLLIVRTRWEDRTLQAELAGYEEYTQRVRSRWIPGVW